MSESKYIYNFAEFNGKIEMIEYIDEDGVKMKKL